MRKRHRNVLGAEINSTQKEFSLESSSHGAEISNTQTNTQIVPFHRFSPYLSAHFPTVRY
jgi:hypothetical protein